MKALQAILGKETIAPLQWKYEVNRLHGNILFPLSPPPTASYGEFKLGSVIQWNGRSMGTFGLWANELPQHIAIFGRTGAGKTNCGLLLVGQLLSQDVPFIILDWKQSYRVVQSHTVRLYTPGLDESPFYFNPLNLNRIPLQLHEGYLRHLVSVVLNAYMRDLRLLSVEGVEYLLLRGLDFLRQELEVFSFQDLYFWLLRYAAVSRERDWKSSAVNILYKLTTGPIGRTLNEKKETNFDNLISAKSVIELQWLGSPKDKSFLIQALLLQVYYHFIRNNSSPSVRLVIFIEEAHNVLLRHANAFETICDFILRQIREYGVSICLFDQHPSLMSLPALGTFCTICFNLRAEEDIRVMAGALGLNDDKDSLGYLKRGQAIVKLQDRWIKPFLVSFPKSTIGGDFAFSRAVSGNFVGNRDISNRDNTLPEEEKKLLIDIVENPIVQVTKRYKKLNLNPRKGNLLQVTLINKELVSSVIIKTATGRVKLLQVTAKGWEILRGYGISVTWRKRRGGLLHQFWLRHLKNEYAKAGYRVQEEYSVGAGKTVDLVAEKEEHGEIKRVAIEVETGESDVKANVSKCTSAGFETIIVVAVDEHVKNRLKGLASDLVKVVSADKLKI